MTEYLTDEQMGSGQKDYLTSEQTSGAERPKGFSETAADVGKSLAAGSLRGTAGIADLPMDLAGLAVKGGEWVTGGEAPDWLANPIEKSQGFYRRGMSDLTGGFSEREAETTAGQYAGTVGEFLTPAAGAGLLKKGLTLGERALRAGTNVMTGAVVPGLASEGLGQAFEDTPYETPARIAGAILGGIGGNKLENITRGAISPGGAGRATNLADARLLRDQDVRVSASQATGRPSAQMIEAKNPIAQDFASISLDSPQLKDLTTASLRHAGLTDDIVARVAARPDLRGADPMLASRPMIDELFSANGVKFNDALSGVPTQLSNKFLGDVRQALKPFDPPAPGSGYPRKLPPVVIRDLVQELNAFTKGGPPIPAARLQEIRSQLGTHLTDVDTDVVNSARQLRDALDAAIDGSVQAIGQPGRMDQLLRAREEYRALLAIEEAVKRSKLGVNGIITPDALYAGVQSTQGMRATVAGRGMPLADLSDAAKRTITPLPAPPRKTLGRFMPAVDIGAIGSAAFAGPQIAMLAAGNPMLATLLAGGAGTAAAVDLARRAVSGTASKYAHTAPVQRYLENQLVNPSSGIDDISAGVRGAMYGAPSVLAEREGRKSGGRVGGDHAAAADQLVRAAERAKKELGRSTEPLLNQSDDAVAHALEVANRSI
jgi:hypothetical protein